MYCGNLRTPIGEAASLQAAPSSADPLATARSGQCPPLISKRVGDVEQDDDDQLSVGQQRLCPDARGEERRLGRAGQ